MAIGLISNNTELDYKEKVQHLATWCADSNQVISARKTTPILING